MQVNLPELRNHHVLAHTPEGLLVLLRQRPRLVSVCLLNPLTRHLIELPPLTTLLPQPQEEQLALSPDYIRYFRAWGSGIANNDSTVVLCFFSLGLLGMAKPGDECWTLVRLDNRLQTSPLMFAGRFYCFSVDGLMVLETSPPRMEVAARRNMVVSAVRKDSLHLVDNAGVLMLVHRRERIGGGEGGMRWRYDINRVDLGTRTLVQINSFGGGRALFLGMDHSLSVPTEVFPSGSITGDTIYLRFDIDERSVTEAYHVADRSIEPAILNLDGSMPQPHTLVGCLCLTSPVGMKEDAMLR